MGLLKQENERRKLDAEMVSFAAQLDGINLDNPKFAVHLGSEGPVDGVLSDYALRRLPVQGGLGRIVDSLLHGMEGTPSGTLQQLKDNAAEVVMREGWPRKLVGRLALASAGDTEDGDHDTLILPSRKIIRYFGALELVRKAPRSGRLLY